MVIKFPTRGRPQKFVSVLDKYINFLSGMHDVHFVVSFDHDDPSMNNDNMWSLFNRLNSQLDGRIHPVCGKSTGKISAINADLDVVRRLNPDVILLASDDMIPIHGGYDDVIARAMAKFFPDTDGVLWFNDGFSGGNKLITLSILGRKYFERFGYLYYPGYKSVFCDNEFTDVAKMLGKVVFIDHVIIQHQWVGATTPDALHARNESPEMYAHDQPLYEERKAMNFGLDIKPSLVSSYPPVETKYSQNNEQSVIMSYLEKNDMVSGKLLDVGAFDGETFSNVRAVLERFKNWKGVLVEPSSFCFSKIFEMYKAEPKRVELVNAAVLLEKDSEVTLIEFHESPNSAASSIQYENVSHYATKEKNVDGDVIDPRKIYVGATTLKKLLSQFGGSFDFINIDVEGFSSELVLQDSFNPIEYNCKLLCVEVDLDKSDPLGSIAQVYRKKMDEKFLKLGYKVLGSTPENQIYGL
jgi:FkbM family methyltransferase